jgi:hypothetical protein
MRRGKWLFGCVIAGVAGVSMATGCGDDTVANTPMDSGAPDQTTDQSSPVDSGAVEAEAEAAPPCVPDSSLSMLMVPDASLDEAGDTIAGCIACIMSNCGPQVTTCSGDCACNAAVQQFVQCVASGKGALSCGTTLAQAGGPNATVLGLCVAGPMFGGSGPGCIDQCGASNLVKDGGDAATTEGGSDATLDSSGEASTDAASGG